MDNNIELSIIVLSYNNSNYVTDCLKSIYYQNLDNYEVLIVDDESDDDSVDVINNYIKDKSEFFLIEKPHSGGAVSVNIALSRIKGKYFAIVDSDDLVADGAYNRLIRRIENDGSDFAAGLPAKLSSGFMFRPVNNKESSIFCNDHVLETDEEIAGFSKQVFYWNCVYCTDFIKSNNIKMPEGLVIADRVFLYNAILHAKKISIDSNIVYYWRRKQNEESRSITDRVNDYNMISDRCDSFEEQIKLAPSENCLNNTRVRIIWENSLARLFYPLYYLSESTDVEKSAFFSIFDRYRFFVIEYKDFFEQLIYTCNVGITEQIVIELLLKKKYEMLFEYLKEQRAKKHSAKISRYNLSRNIQSNILKQNNDICISEIQVDNNVKLKYLLNDELAESNDLHLKKVIINYRYFGYHELGLPFDSETIDISSLVPSTYILSCILSKNGSLERRLLDVDDRYSGLLKNESDDHYYIFNTGLSMLKVVRKNSFTILKNSDDYYIKVSDAFDDFSTLLFYNVEHNTMTELSECSSRLFLVQKQLLHKGKNILFFRTKQNMYDTVFINGISNLSFNRKDFDSIVNKNRIEINKR